MNNKKVFCLDCEHCDLDVDNSMNSRCYFLGTRVNPITGEDVKVDRMCIVWNSGLDCKDYKAKGKP